MLYLVSNPQAVVFMGLGMALHIGGHVCAASLARFGQKRGVGLSGGATHCSELSPPKV